MDTPKRILVVDDSPTIVDIVRSILEAAGCEVLTSLDGLAGVNIALREVPDLVISDVEMPEMTGLQLCRLLKSDSRTSGMPILILSAHGARHEQFWGRETGADDYLPKPFTPESLLARVRPLLARLPPARVAAPPSDVPAATRVEALQKVTAALERRLFELTVVHGISAIAATASGERDTAREVLDRMSRLVDFRAGGLAFPPEGNSFLLIRSGVHPRALQALHAGLIGALPAREGAPKMPVLLSGAEFVSMRASAEDPAVALLPLRAAGDPVAVLGIAREADRPFTEPEEGLLELLAEQAGLVLENARLEEARRAHALALAHQNEELRRLNATITDMIGTVTHDLKTPLNSVLGYLELVLDEETLKPEAREFLAVVQRNAERMLRMVNDLLDISRLESGRVRLEARPTSLGHLVDAVAETLRPALAAKQQSYRQQVAPDLPAVVADAERLHQALANLLSNAIKYTPSGGRIRVVAGVEGDRVRVAVEDTGIGLSEEDCRQVFRKFFRAHRPELDGVPGTGLGLTIVKMVIELHGGEVFVRSRLNEGSTFGFYLPPGTASPSAKPGE
ncbi:MAG: response regulator [Armatimonadetes bacterium]|nr:response regulator [Armatimonadota bacterium]